MRRREALDAVGTLDELPVFDREEVVAAVISTSRGMDGSAEAIPQGRGHGRIAGCKSGRVDLCAYRSGVYGARKVLRDNVEYWGRSRDPVASL